jgi:hypothetical protein
MKVCILCNEVEVKGEWRPPEKKESLLVIRGQAEDAVCPDCDGEASTGGENAL